MPSKGYSYHRENIIDKKFFEKFIQQYPEYENQLDYNQFKDVILDSNKEFANIIINDENGIKLPVNLGYIVVSRFKAKNKAIDWNSTNKYGKKIYHNNLHTFGYTLHIKWFKAGIAKFPRNRIFKFEACRSLKRSIAKQGQQGNTFLEWKATDFWTASKLERTFRKQFKVSE